MGSSKLASTPIEGASRSPLGARAALSIRSDIREYLRAALPADAKVYYKPNPGNAGDALIACATLQLFGDLGVAYQLIDGADIDAEGKVLVYGGGGNLVPAYESARDFVLRHHERARKLIVLPHTIVGNEDLLRMVGDNVEIIAREKNSYEHLLRSGTRAKIVLLHDMAFCLDLASVLARNPFFDLPFKTVAELRHKFGSGLRFELSAGLRRATERRGARVLDCFRTDSEASGAHRPSRNADLSRIYAYGLDAEAKIGLACYRVLRFITHYDEINTDRLHICIASAMLGKTVNLFPNNYFKNAAVYEHSIRGRFPNVRWAG